MEIYTFRSINNRNFIVICDELDKIEKIEEVDFKVMNAIPDEVLRKVTDFLSI